MRLSGRRRCFGSPLGRTWRSGPFRALAFLGLTAGAALALWLPVASANDRPTADHLRAGLPTAHVRWSGYHGVKFGEQLSAAAKKLHGRVASDEPRSDAHYLSYPGELVAISGTMRWEGSGGLRYQVRSGRKVGSFQGLSGRVIFPRRTFIGESLARFRRSLGKGARPEKPEHNAAIGYYLVGPRGRTLWGWGSSSDGVVAIGLAESLAGARVDWGNEG